jgi:hypothetical protein
MIGRSEHEGCSCGHRLPMCHRVNAAKWCGEPQPVEVYRQALIRCAELAGADLSDGLPTWPSLEAFAVQAVEQLRADYDEVIEGPKP